MGLNICVTGADEYGRYLKCLLCGDPGAGKTRSSSTWPNPLLASVNANLMSVADRAMIYAPIHTSADMLQLRHTLDNPPDVRQRLIGRPVDTLVVDTIDHFQQLLAAERRRDEKKDVLAGPDWGWLGDEMRSALRGLRNLPLHVVLLCHLKMTEDMEAGKVYLRPSLQGAVGDEIAGYVDVALALKAVTTLENAADGGAPQRVVHRYAQTYPDPQLPWVRDNSGNLPPEFEINFEDDFARLHAAVFGSLNLPASSLLGIVDDAAVMAARQERVEVQLHVIEQPPDMERTAQPAPTPAGPEPSVAPVPPPPEPAPQPGPAPAPEQTEEAVANELAAELVSADAEPAAPTNGQVAAPVATAEPELPPCDDCGNAIENEDQRDLALLRFRRPLCRTCFIANKQPGQRPATASTP
jgi:hypothetical protein